MGVRVVYVLPSRDEQEWALAKRVEASLRYRYTYSVVCNTLTNLARWGYLQRLPGGSRSKRWVVKEGDFAFPGSVELV